MAKITKGRVKIPRNVEEHLALAQKVFEKHQSEGEASVLKSLDGLDWNQLGPEIANCLAKHLEAESYKQKMENAYRERDMLLPQIEEILRASKSLLKAVYPRNPKKLGEWGFSIDDSPKAKKKDDPEIGQVKAG